MLIKTCINNKPWLTTRQLTFPNTEPDRVFVQLAYNHKFLWYYKKNEEIILRKCVKRRMRNYCLIMSKDLEIKIMVASSSVFISD